MACGLRAVRHTGNGTTVSNHYGTFVETLGCPDVHHLLPKMIIGVEAITLCPRIDSSQQ